MSNIKDLYVIDIKIIDDRIEELEEFNKANPRTFITLTISNIIEVLKILRSEMNPLEPIVSDAFDKGYASDSHAEDKEQFLNNIKL